MQRIVIMLMLVLIPSFGYSQDISDYLIIDNIGSYEKITKGGPSGNILAGAGHFGVDHKDKSYGIAYVNDETKIWVDVQVTQHAGSESDKWLLHEVERDFRSYYGLPDESFMIRQIDNNTVLAMAVAGWAYRWVSGNKIIQISYHDLQMEKPEPLEIVSAYLAKHPSTLTPITSADLRTDTNKTTWIKDEMDRRLWLCDKWVEQKQAGTVDVDKLLRKMHDHMKVFLNYKKKYYGIDTDNEKIAIYEYMQAKDEASMKSKLAEYKAWWTANKDGAINL